MMSKKPWSAVHKLTTQLFAIFIVFTVSFSSFAASQASQVETLLISDIDDTLKVTRVLNRLDTIQNALKTNNPFLGMTSLFQMLEKDQENFVFAYLSNAPESLMAGRHAALLKNAKFPEGELFLRADTSDNEHKNRTIRALVAKHQPKNLILIGDNAEQDTMIYSRAAAEFSNLNVKVYIHQLYSVAAKSEAGKKLEKDQMGYVTAVDLAMHWRATGMVKDATFDAWVSQVVPMINKEALNISAGALAFPKWMNCKDFKPVREEEDLSVDDILIAQYVEKRDKRCQIR